MEGINKDFELGFQVCALWVCSGLPVDRRGEFTRRAGLELEQLRSAEDQQQAVNRVVALLIHGQTEAK